MSAGKTTTQELVKHRRSDGKGTHVSIEVRWDSGDVEQVLAEFEAAVLDVRSRLVDQ